MHTSASAIWPAKSWPFVLTRAYPADKNLTLPREGVSTRQQRSGNAELTISQMFLQMFNIV